MRLRVATIRHKVRTLLSGTVTGAVEISVARVVGLGLGIIATGLVGRSLGPSRYATFSLGLTLIIFTNMVSDFGMAPIVIRDLNQNPEPGLIRSITIMRSCLGTLGGAICVCIAYGMTSSGRDFVTCVLLLMTAPLAGLTTGEIVAQARARYSLLASFMILQSLLWVATAGLLYALHSDDHEWAIGFAGSSVVTALVVWGWARSQSRHFGRATLQVIKRVLSESWYVGAGTLVVLAYHRVDYLLLYVLRSRQTTGLYGASFRIIDQVLLVPFAFTTAFLPALARVEIDRGARRRYLLAAYRLVIIVSAALALLLFASPELWVRMAFGDAYKTAAPFLRVLAFALPGLSISYLSFQSGIVFRRSRSVFLSTLGVLVSTTALTVLLVRSFGSMGAAVSTVITESVAAISLTWIAYRGEVRSQDGAVLAQFRSLSSALHRLWISRFLLVLTIAGGCAWLLRTRQLLALVSASIIYGVGLYWLRLAGSSVRQLGNRSP